MQLALGHELPTRTVLIGTFIGVNAERKTAGLLQRQRCTRSRDGAQGHRLLKIDFPVKKACPNFLDGIDSNPSQQLAIPLS